MGTTHFTQKGNFDVAKTKPYDWTQFSLKIEIMAPPEKVYQAWTDDAKIVKWFVEKAVIEPKKNGRIYLVWLGEIAAEYRVTAVRKNGLFGFTFGENAEEVLVRIRKSGHGSVCELRQFNLKTGPADRVAWHMGCKTGWTFFLANLKAWLEHGIDLRSHDPKKSYREGYCNS